MLTEKSEEFVTLMFQNIQQQGKPFNIRKTKEPIHITICLFLSHSKESATFGVARHMQKKNEKQVGCYVTLDGVETFSDT